jgi:hypothetical protein
MCHYSRNKCLDQGLTLKSQSSYLKLFLFITLIIRTADYSALTYYARADGNWTSLTAWSLIGVGSTACGCVPGSGDDVVIDGYDITISSGNITVNNLIIRSSTRNDRGYLIVSTGRILTISGDLQMFIQASRVQDVILEIKDNSSKVNVGDDLIITQSNGNIIIDVENTAQLNVTDDVSGTRSAGTTTDFRLNENLGTGANINIGGDFSLSIDNFNVNGVEFLLNAASCQFSVAGTFSLSANTATTNAAEVNFALNGGTMTIGSAMYLNRASNCGNIMWHFYGGHLAANSLSVSSSGSSSSNQAVRFFVDDNSTMNITNDYNATISGGGYLCLETNVYSGTSATIHIGGNYTINRSGGGEIHIYSEYNNSLIDIDGNLTITSSGGEGTFVRVHETATMSIGGNFSINHTEGQNVDIYVVGGGVTPLLNIAGSMSVSMAGGADDCTLRVMGGTLSVGADCYLSNAAGSNDFSVTIDGSAQMTVGSNLTCSLTGGDDMTIGLGETTAGSTCKLDVGGHMQMIHNYNNGGALMYLNVHENSELEAGQLTLTQNYTAPALFLIDVPGAGIVDVDGNINFNAAGGGEVEMRMAGTSTLQIMGSIMRANSPNRFGKVNCSGGGTIEFNGITQQFVAGSTGDGGDEIYYRTLILNNTGTFYPQFMLLTNASPVTINNSIKFIDGVMYTYSPNILIIPDNATAISASDASYVDGPVRKIGNDAFTFPIGDGSSNYQPITITAPGVGTDAFDAQYFETDPGPTYDSTQKASGINHVSKCEYWILNRTTGTSNVVVGLVWDSHSCGVTNLSDLRVARWNGSQWANHGNGGTTGNTTAGTINTSGNVTSFSPFTLASSQRSSNPLPVELTEFDAVKSGDVVLLDWSTAVEKNCNYFEIERSLNGAEWEFVTSQKALGSNTDYNAEDMNPHKGVSYYRLKSIDLDGSFSHSKIVAVSHDELFDLRIYPNPATHDCFVEGRGMGNAEIVVLDALGQIMYVPKHSDSENRLHLNTSNLKAGLYLLKISKGSHVRTERLFIHNSN